MEEDWKNEKGLGDATYQDFVAPLVLGIGGIPRILSAVSKAPAIASGLGVAEKASEDHVSIPMETIENLVNIFQDAAQKIGDFPRVFKYKALRTALGEGSISPDEAANWLSQIHADVQ